MASSKKGVPNYYYYLMMINHASGLAWKATDCTGGFGGYFFARLIAPDVAGKLPMVQKLILHSRLQNSPAVRVVFHLSAKGNFPKLWKKRVLSLPRRRLTALPLASTTHWHANILTSNKIIIISWDLGCDKPKSNAPTPENRLTTGCLVVASENN